MRKPSPRQASYLHDVKNGVRRPQATRKTWMSVMDAGWTDFVECPVAGTKETGYKLVITDAGRQAIGCAS